MFVCGLLPAVLWLACFGRRRFWDVGSWWEMGVQGRQKAGSATSLIATASASAMAACREAREHAYTRNIRGWLTVSLWMSLWLSLCVLSLFLAVSQCPSSGVSTANFRSASPPLSLFSRSLLFAFSTDFLAFELFTLLNSY